MFRKNSVRNRWMIMTAAAFTGLGVLAVLPMPLAHAQDMAKPADQMNIIQVATGPHMEKVTTLVKAVQAAGLVETLEGPGPFTVFAPTNAAFDKLPAGALDDLLKPENKDKLKKILLYHVHAGDAIDAKDAKTMELSTAEGAPLHITVDGDTVKVNDAKVIKADIHASNGTIHWINKVLMPPEDSAK